MSVVQSAVNVWHFPIKSLYIKIYSPVEVAESLLWISTSCAVISAWLIWVHKQVGSKQSLLRQSFAAAAEMIANSDETFDALHSDKQDENPSKEANPALPPRKLHLSAILH